MPDARATRGVLLALSSAALWGITGAIAGGVFSIVPPAYVAETRALITVAVLVPYAIYRGVFRPPASWWKFAVLGVNLAVVNVTFYWALDLLGVGPGATIQFLAPTLVLLWMKLVRRSSVRPLAWIAAVGAVTGVAMVTEAWALESSDLIGIAAGLASAATFASYLIYGEYLGKSFPPAQITTWGFIFASAIWLVVLPVWTFPADVPMHAWRDILIIGVLGTAVPFIFGFQALRMAGSAVVGVAATAEPAIAAIAAAILLGQQLSLVQWSGVAIVVTAVAIVERFGLVAVEPATPLS